MREGTMGSRSVRVLEGGPRLPFNPSRISLSEPWLCFVRSFWPSYKSVSVGQVSDFPGPEKEARNENYSLPHGPARGSVADRLRVWMIKMRLVFFIFFASLHSGADISM